ncbi:META domain-containing protein [Crenobacter cavernae]|uniref:META domain-containing protein n=1 Tax=Crenobacter cavernae TaxID=2290923 RepID=A0ABY0FEA9_9NEIS|nr:META domain-containing protein [Crenobacter cavernae]
MRRSMASWRACALFVLSASMVGCATGGGGAGAGDGVEAAPLRARGNEPFWSLDIGSTLRFAEAGGLRVEGAAPPVRMVDGVRRYAGKVSGRAIDVAVTPRVCRDDMTGMPHPFSVSMAVDGRRYRGCGGEPVALLRGAEWVVEDIGGGGIIDSSRATLNFRDGGRLDGRASCNSYSTSYTLTGESLTVGRGASTLMACAPALMQQEQRFLDILQGVNRFEISDTGALVLIDAQGRKITARR